MHALLHITYIYRSVLHALTMATCTCLEYVILMQGIVIGSMTAVGGVSSSVSPLLSKL